VAEPLWLGQFNLVGGGVQEDGPYAATTITRSVAESVADFCITLQPYGNPTGGILEEALAAAARIFGRTQYSITANLLLALDAVHKRLQEWNLAHTPDERVAAGVSCVAFQGSDCYLAQAGPSTAFLLHARTTERLEPVEPDSRIALGAAGVIAPCFRRLALARGDALLLVTEGIGASAETAAVARCLERRPEDVLPAVLHYLGTGADGGVIFAGVLEDPAPARTLLERGVPGGASPTPAQPLVRQSDVSSHQDSTSLGRNRFQRVDAAHPDAGGGVLRVYGAEMQRDPRRPLKSGHPSESLRAAAGVARPSVRLSARHPSFRDAFRGGGWSQRLLRPPVLATFGVVFLVAVAWLAVPALMGMGRSQRFETLLTTAQRDLNAAQSEVDLSKRRELLSQAQTSAAEAQRLKPQDQRAQRQANDASGAISIMNAVYELPDVPSIADLSNAGLSPSTAVELAAGDRLYVLDVSAGKVYAVSDASTTGPEVMYENGSQIDGIRAGKAQHLAWQPPARPGDAGALLILDADRHLFGLSRGDLRSIPLRGVEQWRTATAMAFNGGSLYILDADGGLVWRYAPSSDGFDTDPAPAIARQDIRDTTQISVVGGIFLTSQTGQDARIRRFLDGQETPFKLAGIDRTPVAPGPPLFDPASGLLYIADRGNSRVVVLQGDGRFQRQLVHAKLAGLRGLAVDSPHNRLVGVIGQALVAIPLPN
jgi:hypothetical protein